MVRSSTKTRRGKNSFENFLEIMHDYYIALGATHLRLIFVDLMAGDNDLQPSALDRFPNDLLQMPGPIKGDPVQRQSRRRC